MALFFLSGETYVFHLNLVRSKETGNNETIA